MFDQYNYYYTYPHDVTDTYIYGSGEAFSFTSESSQIYRKESGFETMDEQ